MLPEMSRQSVALPDSELAIEANGKNLMLAVPTQLFIEATEKYAEAGLQGSEVMRHLDRISAGAREAQIRWNRARGWVWTVLQTGLISIDLVGINCRLIGRLQSCWKVLHCSSEAGQCRPQVVICDGRRWYRNFRGH